MGLRLLNEEGEIRSEADTKLGRSMSQMEEALADEADKRSRECRELLSKIDQCTASLKTEQRERSGLIDELNERLLQARRTMTEEQKKRGNDLSETNGKIREVRDVIDQERQARLNDFSGLAERVDELTRSMRDDQSQWIELQRKSQKALLKYVRALSWNKKIVPLSMQSWQLQSKRPVFGSNAWPKRARRETCPYPGT